MYKELNKLKHKTTQDRVWSIRDLHTNTLTQKERLKRLSVVYCYCKTSGGYRFSGPFNYKLRKPYTTLQQWKCNQNIYV